MLSTGIGLACLASGFVLGFCLGSIMATGAEVDEHPPGDGEVCPCSREQSIVHPLRNNVPAVKRFFKNKEFELCSLVQDIAEWSEKQFGTPIAKPKIAHLKEEVEELYKSPDDITEYADCFMLLLDAANAAQISPLELIKATRDKLEENKLRKWGKPDSEGIVHHYKNIKE